MTNKKYPSAIQKWLLCIPVMQQSVLLSAIRGPDGFAKHHPVKGLLKFYRRCVLISAFESSAIDNPYDIGGGSFTGPSLELFFGNEWSYIKTKEGETFRPERWREAMFSIVSDFIHSRDEMTLHYYVHAMHAFQILGENHPNNEVADFWQGVYLRMVNALHLMPEPVEELNRRLSDNSKEWSLKADEAGSCSE